MTEKKRAIALSGGGPAVGIEIGALKAFEKMQIEFDIYPCACVGSWVGCLYNSLIPNKNRLQLVEAFFKDEIFIPDEIYESFPINYKVFRMDYLNDFQKTMEKIYDPNTYQNLFLPNRIWEFVWDFLKNPPKNSDEYFYLISEGLALNPLARFYAESHYKTNKSGISGLINSKNFIAKHINFKQLFKSDKIIYMNAYNLSENQMEIFINRKNHSVSPINEEVLMAGSSVLHYTENKTIGGKECKYCEGAVVNTVSLDHLLDDHPDLDEIWVVKIVDHQEAKPSENLIEASLLGVMLPFATISDNDIKLFSYKLREFNEKNEKNIKLINILMDYETINYHWNHSNLDQGIKVGYRGALEAIRELEENQYADGKFSHVDIVS